MEIDHILRAGEARLVTLTGPGGVGKTRLALEAASHAADAFPDGATVVWLAPVADPTLVLPTFARALGLVPRGGQPLLEVVRSYLQQRQMLMVLDNVEQVLEAAGEVADLLSFCAGIVVLATSRAPLRVRGEREYPVRPLETPTLDRVPEPSDIEHNPAVHLFVERARAVVPTFELSRRNAAAVAAICRRLDGLPLALELAAARVRTLAPTELLARLDRSLPLLTGGARDLPDRQRTMRAAIGWSYQLLREPEWRLLNRLAVFRGGWTLEAAEVVGAREEIGHEEVLDLLTGLVEQSLVVVETPEDGATRYRMFVPVREYAEEQLEQNGEAEATRRRHAGYFLALAEAAEPELQGPRQVAWLDQLEREHDNLRVALAWLLAAGDADTAVRLSWALWVFWWIHNYQSEARRWAEQILERGCGLSPRVRARALCIGSVMAMGQGDVASAESWGTESYALLNAQGDTLAAARAALILGLLSSIRGDIQRAESSLQEAASSFRDAGAHFWAALALSALGMVPFRLGDYEQAGTWLGEGLTSARMAGDRFSRYMALYNHSQLAQARGDTDHAARLFQEGLAFSREVGDRANIAYCLEGLADVAVARGKPARAARLLGVAERLFEAVGARMYGHRPGRPLHEQAVAEARARLGEQGFDAARDEGRAMTSEQAVEYVLAEERTA